MKQLRVSVDIGLLETGINVGDAIEAIIVALKPLQKQAYATDDFDTLLKYGTIEHLVDEELIGEWEIAERK
jgi:hypothetical protein